MNNVPKKLRQALATDPEYKVCALSQYGECDGIITWEHAIIYANKQIQERWAIVPLCERHHGVNRYMDFHTLDKDKNVWVALNRATDEELGRYSKVMDYRRMRKVLNAKFGEYKPPYILGTTCG